MKLRDIYNTKEVVKQQITFLSRRVELAEYNLKMAYGELKFLDELEDEILEGMKLEANYEAEDSTLLEDVLVDVTEEA